MGFPRQDFVTHTVGPYQNKSQTLMAKEQAYGRKLNADNPMLARNTRPYLHPSCKEVLAESVLEEAQALFEP